MNNQNLIIYEFTPLFDILNEIKDQLSFNLLNVSKKEFSELKIDELENYLIFSKKNEVINLESQIFIDNYPLFLKKSKEPVTINNLQIKVWGHQSKLETHTVETHIYRLRKKISSTFGDNEFIKSSKFGYIIK